MKDISLCPEISEKVADLLLGCTDNVILLYAGTYIRSLEKEIADLRAQMELPEKMDALKVAATIEGCEHPAIYAQGFNNCIDKIIDRRM